MKKTIKNNLNILYFLIFMTIIFVIAIIFFIYNYPKKRNITTTPLVKNTSNTTTPGTTTPGSVTNSCQNNGKYVLDHCECSKTDDGNNYLYGGKNCNIDAKSYCSTNSLGTFKNDININTDKPNCNCKPGYTGDKCETSDVNLYKKDDVINMLNGLKYVKENYEGNFEKMFNEFKGGDVINGDIQGQGSYILILCKDGGKYYNFCSQYGRNYYDSDNNPIAFAFKNSEFNDKENQNKGDLITNIINGIGGGEFGFWWNNNTTTCPPPTNSNTQYISIDEGGNLNPGFNLGNNVAFFPKIFTKGIVGEINLGVLLIGPS